MGWVALAAVIAASAGAAETLRAHHADAVIGSARESFVLPYDLALEPDGTILFLDRSRILARHPRSGRVRVWARTPSSELIAMERLASGALFVTDFPGHRILRVTRAGRVSTVARVQAPADLVADSRGTTLWVASIAEGVGVVRVDVASGRVEPFATPVRPHGIDRAPNGDFVVHDGRAVSRIDGDTGAVTRFADVDAFKLHLAPDGSVYGIVGSPSGGRVVRIGPGGQVTPIAGTGRIAPHRDGPALRIGILPSSVVLAPGGDVLFTQVEPRAAVRRVDRRTGLVRTLALGR
jgi:streptogramin lyase